MGVEKGAIEFLAPKTQRAPPPGHWRVFARRHHTIFEFLGRRPQNARYFVRLNGAVAPASRRARTHVSYVSRPHQNINIPTQDLWHTHDNLYVLAVRWHTRRDVRKHTFDMLPVHIKIHVLQPKFRGERSEPPILLLLFVHYNYY